MRTKSPAVEECTAAIPTVVRKAAGVLAEYVEPETVVAEVADTASDLLPDAAVYLTAEEDADVYAEITREVFARFGIPSGSSDGTSISNDDLRKVAEGRVE